MSQLEKIKKALGITGDYQNDTLQVYIDEVKRFLSDGGADESFLESDESTGLISRGVADLWNYGTGGTGLSPYFLQRAIQVCTNGGDEDG